MVNTNFDYSSSVEQIAKAAMIMAIEMNIFILVIKLGEKGALCVHKGEYFVVPPFIIEVANTIGAGDTFIAMLSLSLTNSIPLKNSIYLANKAASVSISKRYTGSCYLNELK
jgi:sugar/nucleoside kinase (ribokinase family)